jgi:hypothetical protein
MTGMLKRSAIVGIAARMNGFVSSESVLLRAGVIITDD